MEQIPENFKPILDLIKKQEGGYLHRNKNEKDITTGYGIYRHANPKAVVWSYIDSLAKQLGIKTPSPTWTNDQIKSVNTLINPELEKYYSYLFYKDYFKNTGLADAHPIVQPVIVSLFTNGQKLYNMSLQRALNALIKEGVVKDQKLVEDGVVGPKTLALFKVVSQASSAINEKLKLLILLYAKSYYATLIGNNPGSYAQYSKGWDSRVNQLI